jgi:hypothetical protein
LRERIDLAVHRKNRRWMVDHSQALRVFRLAKGEKFDTRCVSAALSGVVAQDEFPVRRQLKINRR